MKSTSQHFTQMTTLQFTARTILLWSLWLAPMASAKAEQVTRQGQAPAAAPTTQTQTQSPQRLGVRSLPEPQSTPSQSLAQLQDLLRRASSPTPLRVEEVESLIEASHSVFQDVLKEELKAHKELRSETAKQLAEFTARMIPRDPNGTVVDNLLLVMSNKRAAVSVEREIRTLPTALRDPLERELKLAREAQNLDGN
ncbi:MAG TPA: hypothetical protein PLZ57_08525 [Pseudobdellovibrionaceae bacterium]|nr:hypothetical protein [Pseudobdellovibrionaceae bacterium]